MSVKLKILMSYFLLLSCFCQSQNATDSLKLYQDVLYLGNMQYGSNNPTSISFSSMSRITDVNVDFLRKDGNLHLIDEPSKEQWWGGRLFGIQKFGRITFEGDVQYENGKQTDKRWNSTLFIADDNPFIVGDSLTGNYNVEKFRLNGGFSYEINNHWRAGLRAIYKVGSSADQTDPRPDIKGMRFLLNPGVDYKLGNFIFGMSGGICWLGESVDYTVVKTYENYQLFLFKGMGTYEGQQAIGFKRKYTGTAYQGNFQLLWDSTSSLANFLELGVEKNLEEAVDGSSSNKYKGGKYKSSKFSFLNRFRIKKDRIIHNITLEAINSKTEGTWYIQTQISDADGNTSWEVKEASVCHKETRTEASLTYRMDLLKHALPHFTWQLRGGLNLLDTKNYPEVYLQKFTSASIDLSMNKNFNVKKSMITISIAGIYNHNLSSKLEVNGLKLKDFYTTPTFESMTAAYYQGSAGVSARIPLFISNFRSCLGVYAEYAFRHYNGDYIMLNGADRNWIKMGINFAF